MTMNKIVLLIFAGLLIIVSMLSVYIYYDEQNFVNVIKLSDHYMLVRVDDFDGSITWSLTNKYYRRIVPGVEKYAVYDHFVFGSTDQSEFFILDTELNENDVLVFESKVEFDDRLRTIVADYESLVLMDPMDSKPK